MSKRRAFNKESLEWRQEKASTHHEVHSSKAKSTLSFYSKRRRTSDHDQDQFGGSSGNVTADELSNKWQIPTRSTHRPHTNNDIVNINRSKRRLFQVENDDNRIYDKNTRTNDKGQSARESLKVASRIEDEINLISEAESSDSEVEAIDNHRIRMLDMPDKRLAMKTAWTVPNTTQRQPSTDNHKSKTNEVVSGFITSQLRDLHLDNNHLEYRYDNSNIRLISPLKDCDPEWDDPDEITKSESTSESLMKISAASNLKSSSSILKDSFQESSTIRLISPLKDGDDDSLDESSDINLFPKRNYNFRKAKNDAKHPMESDNSKLMDNFQDSLTIRLISPLKDAVYNLDGSGKVDFISDSESESFMRKKIDKSDFKKSDAVVVLASSESELNFDAMEDRSIRLISPLKDLTSDGQHSILESFENEVPMKKNHFTKASHHLESAESTFIDHSELYSSIRLISPMKDDISRLDNSSETNVGLKSDRLKNNEDNFNPWTMAVVNHFNKTKTSASSDSQNSEDEFQVRLISPDLTDLGFDFNEDVTNVNKLTDHAEDDKCNRPIIWKPCRKLVFPPSKLEVIRASEFQSAALNEKVSKSTAKTVSQPTISHEEAMIQFNDECNETDAEKCFAKVVGKQRLSAFYRGSKSESSLDHCFSQLLSVSDDD